MGQSLKGNRSTLWTTACLYLLAKEAKAKREKKTLN